MVRRFRALGLACALLVLSLAPVGAARPIVDLHRLDGYFALFAHDSDVPWQPTVVRLDTYSSAPVSFAAYAVDPGDVLTAGSNSRPRAIDVSRRKAVVRWNFTPPGGYRFQANVVQVPLGSRAGFYVIEARRGGVGEQVWIDRTDVGMIAKQTPGGLMIYAADLRTGKPRPHMRVMFVVNSRFVVRYTDARGIVRWERAPWPVFALGQWGSSYAFVSLLPQAPLPPEILGVRLESAVVHAGESVRIVGFARTRDGELLRPARGDVTLSVRNGPVSIADVRVPLDRAGAFSTTVAIPTNARSGDYAVLAQGLSGIAGATLHVDADADGIALNVHSACNGRCPANADIPLRIEARRDGRAVGDLPIQVTIVRSPHVVVGFEEKRRPWAISKWLETTVRTDANGAADLSIPMPTDGLASTYGVTISSGGASAETRVTVPTAPFTIRVRPFHRRQSLGTPLGFDIYANDVDTLAPLGGAKVVVTLSHGASVQRQVLTLGSNGFVRGAFSTPDLGTNLLIAEIDRGGQKAKDADQIDVVPQAQDTGEIGSAAVSLALSASRYTQGERIGVTARSPGARGNTLFTLESALGVESDVADDGNGIAHGAFTARTALGTVSIGAAMVRAGAIAWNTIALPLDTPGRPAQARLRTIGDDGRPGSLAKLAMGPFADGAGTVVLRISRGVPSGSALFDDAPGLLAVGATLTLNSAPPETTWHPWVDSTGEHPEVLGFERVALPPSDLTIAQSDTSTVAWSVELSASDILPFHLPEDAGRNTLSVLKICDDGRVVAGSMRLEVH